MSTQRNARRRTLWIGILSLIVLLSTVLWWTVSLQARSRPYYYQPPNGEVMVYLAPPPGSDSDIPMSRESLGLNGVLVVQSFGDMKRLTDDSAQNVEAVIVHKTLLDEVDANWLQAQYGRGIVVAAVNVTIRELGQLLEDGHFASGWDDGWQIEPFFSMVAHYPTGTAEERERALSEGRSLGSWTGSTDNMNDESGADLFLSIIRRDIHKMRELRSNSAPSDTK